MTVSGDFTSAIRSRVLPSVVVGSWAMHALYAASRKRPLDLFYCAKHRVLMIDGLKVKTNPQVSFIIVCIAGASGRVVEYLDFIEGMYGDRIDGGPERAERLITVRMCEAKRLANTLGFKIKNVFGVGYRAEHLPSDILQAAE